MADRPKRRGGGGRNRGRRPAAQVRRGTVRLPHDVARRVRLGHPWVFKDSLGRRELREAPGQAVELVDVDGEFVGRGFACGQGAIAVRLLTRDPDERVGPELIERRVKSALALRARLLDPDRVEAQRLINGESDGLPAIFADRYGDYLLVQFYSESALAFHDPVIDALQKELSPKAIYTQRRFKPLSGEAPSGGSELERGSPAPVEIEVRENDLKFLVDVTAPLSTGLFGDLRQGREVIARWANGRRTLNLFSYTGAISVYAQHGGATEVVAVDVAAKAHARARRNFTLNGFDAEKPEHIVGDAFKVLARMVERERKFDLVVIDPPAFASGSRGGKPWSAVKDYGELVAASLSVLEPGGILIAASSTHKLSLVDFEGALSNGAARVGTTLRIVERCGLPVDFPTAPGFPEASYLKFVVATRD